MFLNYLRSKREAWQWELWRQKSPSGVLEIKSIIAVEKSYIWIKAKETICDWEARSVEVIQNAAQWDKLKRDGYRVRSSNMIRDWSSRRKNLKATMEQNRAKVIYFFNDMNFSSSPIRELRRSANLKHGNKKQSTLRCSFCLLIWVVIIKYIHFMNIYWAVYNIWILVICFLQLSKQVGLKLFSHLV